MNTSTIDLVKYKLAFPGMPFEKDASACLYEYVFGSNGVFIRAKREGMEVVMPAVSFRSTRIVGLEEIRPSLRIPKLVPAEALFAVITAAWRVLPHESLFYYHFSHPENEWFLIIPSQMSTPGSVHPDDRYDPFSQNALLEIHSHGSLPAFFSSTDDKEENGFRIYAVIGNLDKRPVTICVRVSVYGHRALIPYQYVFEKSPEVVDVNAH